MEDESTTRRRTSGSPAAQRRGVQPQTPAKSAKQAPAALFVEPKVPPERQPPDEPPERPAPPARPSDTADRPPAKARTPRPAQPTEPAPPTEAQPAKAQPAKAQAAKVQAAKVQAAKVPAARKPPAKAATPAKATDPQTKAIPKKATQKKTTQKQAAPTKKTVATSAVAVEKITRVPTPLWERIKANPRYAPELLACAAVDLLGGQVDGYARWLAATYPHATPDSIARYAAQRYAKRAGYAVLVATLTRPLGGLAEAATLTWAHARLVLLIAAAYGHDPADPKRVPELLVLLGIHPDLPTARAALDAAANPTAHAPHGWAGLARGLAAPVSGRRLPARFFPGAGVLLGAIVNSARTEAVARRAVTQYRN
ncbi:MAG: hypothetical protein V7603_1604 [Micromonosporaceae bacterium]